MVKRLWESGPVRFARELVSLYFNKNVPRAAAELAYFLILSFFPILICVNAFIGFLQVDVNYILKTLEPILAPGLLAVVRDYLAYITENASPALFTGGILMTLFSASGAMRSLMNMMDEIYEHKSYKGFRQIVASVIFSLLLLVTIYLSMVVVLTGNWFFHLLQQYLPFQVNWESGALWQRLRFWLLFGMVLLLILLVYRMSMPRGKTRAPLFGGAFIAAAALVGASILFSWFIGMSSRYSLVYGSLASVVILLLWLYLCGNIIILGNAINCVRYRRIKARHDGGNYTRREQRRLTRMEKREEKRRARKARKSQPEAL